MDSNDHVTNPQGSVTPPPRSRCYDNNSTINTPIIRFRASLRSRNDSGYLSSSPALSTSSRESRDRSRSADTDWGSPVFRFEELESDHEDSEDVFDGETSVAVQRIPTVQSEENDVTDDVSFYEDSDLHEDTETVRGSQNSESGSDCTLRSLTESQTNDLGELLHAARCVDTDTHGDADAEDSDISLIEGSDEEISRLTENRDSVPVAESRDIPPRPVAPFPGVRLGAGDTALSDNPGCNDIFIPIPWQRGTALEHPDLHRVRTAPGELNGHTDGYTDMHELTNTMDEFESPFLARGRSASFPEVQPHVSLEQRVGRRLRRLSDEFYDDYTGNRRTRRRSIPAFYVHIDIRSGDSSRFHDVEETRVSSQHDRHTQTDDDDVRMDH